MKELPSVLRPKQTWHINQSWSDVWVEENLGKSKAQVECSHLAFVKLNQSKRAITQMKGLDSPSVHGPKRTWYINY